MGLERSIGKAIIERLATMGYGANEVLRQAREAGGGYARGEMLDDYNRAADRFKNQYWVEALKGNEVVDRGFMVETELGYDAKYRVYGTYSYYDELTGDYYEEVKSFYTDDLANKRAWESDFVDAYNERYIAAGQDFLAFNVTAVEHNSGWGY